MVYSFDRKPYFDKEGNWWIPNEIPFGGELNPSLKPKEWICWLLDISENTPKKAYKNIIGVPVTVWRIREKLRKKGYLNKPVRHERPV